MASFNYATLADQIAAVLRLANKREAVWVHAFFDDNADYDHRLISDVFSSSINEEAKAKRDADDSIEAAASAFAGAHANAVTLAQDALNAIIDNDLPTDADERARGFIDYDYNTPANGQVILTRRRGRAGALYHQMVSDGEKIKKNNVTFGALAPAAGSNNQGNIIVTAAPTGLDHCLSGELKIECVGDSIGNVTFDISLEFTTPLPNETLREADNQLRLGQSFDDGQTGVIGLKLGLSGVSETGDGDDLISGVSITNPTSTDTDRGKLYLKVTRQAAEPLWKIEWFNRSTRDPGELVAAQVVSGVAGVSSVSLLGVGGTTLAFTFHRANANAALISANDVDDDIELDIQSPAVGDKWIIPVTNDEAGKYATKLAHIAPASLNSDAAATANWTDTQASSVTIVLP